MGQSQLAALLTRTGFRIDTFNNLEFDLAAPSKEEGGEPVKMREKYFCIIATKDRPLDIK
jgi:hypothetical protein